MPKKYALKGEPDFHNVGDDRLKSFLDMTQQMIFAYKDCDPEKVKVLESIWKDLSVDSTQRIVDSPDKSPESPTSLLRKVPRVRKSPAKRDLTNLQFCDIL